MLIDGRKIAAELGAELTERVAKLGRPPGLAIVVATGDESTAWYVRSLLRTAEKLGISAHRVDLPGPASWTSKSGVRTVFNARSTCWRNSSLRPNASRAQFRSTMNGAVSFCESNAFSRTARAASGARETSRRCARLSRTGSREAG